MEEHARSSNGEYYVYNRLTGEVKGPFYPNDRTERLSIFVRETQVGDNWYGSYFRRLPEDVRAQIRKGYDCPGKGCPICAIGLGRDEDLRKCETALIAAEKVLGSLTRGQSADFLLDNFSWIKNCEHAHAILVWLGR